MSASTPHQPADGGRPHSRAPGDDNDFLDEFFDRAVEAMQDGREVSFAGLVKGREHLTQRASRLADLARLVAGGPQSMPTFAGYTIMAELGRGGMAAVYLARQERLGGRPVALKVLPPHVSHSAAARARFKAEVLAVARQRDPGIVAVYDILEDGSSLAYTMEWVDGQSLERLIEHVRDNPEGDRMEGVREFLHATASATADPVWWAMVARVGATVARALQSVHESGILHRDIKPSNILIRRDASVLLSDFGLAKDFGVPGLTMTMAFMGTAAYASPEQLQSRAVDARSDVYSLGATLYHALALRPPVDAPTAEGMLAQIRSGRSLDALAGRADVPSDFREIVAKAMRPDPEGRYATAGAMSDDLERLLRRERVAATSGSASRRIGRAARRWRVAIGVAVGVGLAVVGGYLAWGGRADGGAAKIVAAGPFGRPEAIASPQPGKAIRFGASLSGDGDRLLVGAPGARSPEPAALDGAGAAWVFRAGRGGWAQEACLSAPAPVALEDFGSAVLIRGDVAVVGARSASVGAKVRAGAAYVFRRRGSAWVFDQRIEPPRPYSDLGFGHRLAMDGDILAVGCVRPHTSDSSDEAFVEAFRVGAERVEHLQSLAVPGIRWGNTPRMSCAVARGGDTVLVGAGYAYIGERDSAGSVYVFERDAGKPDAWRLTQTIAPADMDGHANFGSYTAADRGRGPSSPGRFVAAATAQFVSGVGTAGCVYVFERTADGVWNRVCELREPLPRYEAFVGTFTDMACGVVAMGTRAYEAGGTVWRWRPLVFRPAPGQAGHWNPPERIDLPCREEFLTAVWPGDGGSALLAIADSNYEPRGERGRVFEGGTGMPGGETVWVWRVPGGRGD